MRYRRALFLILSIVVMIAIFGFSAQPGEKSMRISDSVTESLQIGKTGDSYHYSSVQPILFSLNARKYAHIILYSVLGMSVFLCFSDRKCGMMRRIVLPFLTCFLYACSDELHQYFVPGRTASFKDVLIDSIGFGSVIVVAYVIKIFTLIGNGTNSAQYPDESQISDEEDRE